MKDLQHKFKNISHEITAFEYRINTFNHYKDEPMYRIMLKVLPICILILISYKSLSQESKFQIDSLLKLNSLGENLNAAKLLYNYTYKCSKASGYKKGMAISLIRQGIIMIDQQKYEEAFKFANQSEIIGAEISDNSIITRAMIIKGRAFSAIGFSDISRTILNEAKVYAEKIKAPNQRHFNLALLYRAFAINLEYSNQHDKLSDSIFFYAKLAYTEVKKVDSSYPNTAINVACSYLAGRYIQSKQYDSARFYLNESFKGFEKKKLHILAFRPYFLQGLLNYNDKKYESAISNYNMALKIAMHADIDAYKRDIYLALSNCYKEAGNEYRSKESLEKYNELSKILKSKMISSIAGPIEHIENEKSHASSESGLLWVISFYIVLFLLVLKTIIRISNLFYKEKIRACRKVSLKKKEAEFLNEQLPKKQIDTNELRSVVQMAISNDPAFLLKFRNLDGEFIDKLLQLAPNLVASELELCVQVRLNFETKEIARYTKQSVRSIQGKKHRVRKKLGIPVTEDFNVWMAKL
jgi:tetratricopeptide (TPR) repeat protein